MPDRTSAILFACTMNAIRSPMAEGICKKLFGTRYFVDSVGVRPTGEVDGFAIAVMQEIGVDISRHRPKSFDELDDDFFDVVVSLSPEAQHKAVEMTRVMAVDLEFWRTFDASVVEGSREARLDAYRKVRDDLIERIRARFGES